MEATVSLSQIAEFAITLIVVMAIIFALSVLTPWMAKHVDAWIARYKEHHSPKRNNLYTVRSIYDIPPDEKKAAQQAEIEQTPEDQ